MLAARALALLPPLLAAFATASAAARTDGVALAYDRDPDAFSCPTRAELEVAVAERLGTSPWATRAERAIAVRIEPSAYGYVAEIELYERGERSAERVLSSTGYDCEPLADALVLALAIAIDPVRALAPPPVDEPPPEPPRLLDTGTASASPPPPALDDDPTALSWELGAGVFTGLGAAPGAFLGVTAQGAARSGPLSFHLELRAELPGQVVLSPAGAERAAVGGSLLAASLAPCWRVVGGAFLPNGRFAWGALCGVAQGGALWVSSEGLRDARAALAPFLAFGARLHLDVALLRWLSVRGFVEMLVPVTRVTLTDDVTGASLWEAPAMTLAVGISGISLLP